MLTAGAHRPVGILQQSGVVAVHVDRGVGIVSACSGHVGLRGLGALDAATP